MKKQIALLVLTAASSAFASVYWRGKANEPHGWADTDNSASGSGGRYWSTAESGGNWKQAPDKENGHVKNGGIAVIGDGVTADLGGNKLVLNYNYATRASEVRVLDGGILTNCVVYLSHGSGSNGLLHLIGGKAFIDGKASDSYSDQGLWAPSEGSTASSAGNEVRIDGGLLDVANYFRIASSANARTKGQSARLTITDGEVIARCVAQFGSDDKTSLARGTLVQTGGSFVGLDGTTGVLIGEKCTAEVSGGTFTVPRLSLRGGEANFTGGTVEDVRVYAEAGSTLRFGGNAVFRGAFTGLRRTTPATAGATNFIFVTGGSVTATNVCFNTGNRYGWFGGPEAMRYEQTGGFVTNDYLYVRDDDSGNLRMSIEGGVFYVKDKFSFFGHPFYFRTKGTPEISFDAFPGHSTVNKNNAATNCVIDHVIDRRGLSPLVFRSSGLVFGRHVLRPSGGLQIVATNRFALMRVSGSLKRDCFGCVPDETLWTTAAFADGLGNWGSTLRPGAVCGAAIGRKGGARTFTARPNGYLDLPAIPSNRFESATVKLMVTPQDATLAEIAAGLEAEGYANVREIEEENANLAFEIPADRYPDACGTTKLLFDFTEPVVPDTFTSGPMEFPVRTNALVSACSVDIATKKQGLVLMVR